MVSDKQSAAPTPEQIKAARKAAGLTQAEAGRVIGYTMRGWQNWEHGGAEMKQALYDLFLMRTKSARKSAK